MKYLRKFLALPFRLIGAIFFCLGLAIEFGFYTSGIIMEGFIKIIEKEK